MTEQTIEEMQAELIQLRQEKEALIAKVQSDEEKLTEVNDALKNARAINGKLISQYPIAKETPSKEPELEPEHIETMDEFNDSFIKESAKQLKKIYGSENVGDFD